MLRDPKRTSSSLSNPKQPNGSINTKPQRRSQHIQDIVYTTEKEPDDSDDSTEKLANLSIEHDNDEDTYEDAHEYPQSEPITCLNDLDVPKDEKRMHQSDPEFLGHEKIETQKKDSTEDSENFPLPPRKTLLEKYLNSKQRDEQIKHYNDSVIKETRQKRAEHRARIRQREEMYEQENKATNPLEGSPSKKVRFRIQ